MQVLNVSNLKVDFGDYTLFHDVSFSVNDRDRVAIIGPNGMGKTTLIKVLLNQQEKTSGDVSFGHGVKVGYLSQEVIHNLEHTLQEEVLEVFTDLIEMEKTLTKMEEEISLHPENHSLIEDYGKKQSMFMTLGGYDYHYFIPMMLSKFGFHKHDLTRKIASFSGGERTRIAFVKLLLIKPNLLILDEPTNHLDISTIEWLENYLRSYEGALLFVSHDRYFIDALANKIVEIDNHTSDNYKGNYSYYVEEKKVRYETMLNAYNAQQKEIAKLKKFIEFYKPKPRFVARAKDREKKLEHMDIIDKPYDNKTNMKIKFDGDIYKDKEVIRVTNLTVGYGDKICVENLNFSLYGKDRIAIMGPNGCGKTTLLSAIVDQEHILSGEVKVLRPVSIGYIRQHQILLNDDLSIIEEMKYSFPSLGEKTLYNHLGKFNFDFDDAQKQIKVLSGGEKMRVTLAKIILERHDVLVLDEPTNHLDMVTRQALTLALNEFGGSIIFVSHDRYFVDELASHVLYIDHHHPYFIQGNFMDFKEQESKLLALSEELKDDDEEEEKPVEKPVYKNVAKKRSPLKLEELIKKTESEIAKVKEAQFLEENYMDYKKSQELENKLNQLEKTLAELEEEYLS